jgi:hypothetical protein
MLGVRCGSLDRFIESRALDSIIGGRTLDLVHLRARAAGL